MVDVSCQIVGKENVTEGVYEIVRWFCARSSWFVLMWGWGKRSQLRRELNSRKRNRSTKCNLKYTLQVVFVDVCTFLKKFFFSEIKKMNEEVTLFHEEKSLQRSDCKNDVNNWNGLWVTHNCLKMTRICYFVMFDVFDNNRNWIRSL